MNTVFKVAAVQAAPSFLDLASGIERAVAFIDQAASEGCKLIVFPETWLPGYPNHVWLGPVAWQMQFVGRYFENGIEAGSSEDKVIAEAARRNGIHVSMGLSERDGGSLYISQWHYGEDGEIIRRRRKLKPTHVERTVFGEGDGSDLVVDETTVGRVGQLACWEHLQPLSKYAMYAQNEQVHCAAWPNLALYRGGAYALGEYTATMTAVADFGSGTIAGCLGCVGDIQPERRHLAGVYEDVLGIDLPDHLAPVADYEIRFAPFAYNTDSTFESTEARVTHPTRTITEAEGFWGGSFSNVDDPSGHP